MSQNLSSAAVVIGALRVNIHLYHMITGGAIQFQGGKITKLEKYVKVSGI